MQCDGLYIHMRNTERKWIIDKIREASDAWIIEKLG